MKNIAVLNPETGKIVYCAEWPAIENGMTVSLALANGIEFKDQERIKSLLFHERIKNRESVGPASVPAVWEMEPLKPYVIPERIKIEIKAFCQACSNTQMRNCAHFDTCGAWKQFAFIERQPKEETQDELWRQWIEVIAIIGNSDTVFDTVKELKSRFSIERIK